MLSPGDGIALAGVAAVVIAAIIKFVRRSTNGYVAKETCKARTDGFAKELKLIEESLASMNNRLDDINKFLRGNYDGRVKD